VRSRREGFLQRAHHQRLHLLGSHPGVLGPDADRRVDDLRHQVDGDVDERNRAQQDGELDGYGYAWFASASLGNGASRERVTELLAEAGRRLESADALRIFNEDSLLSADADKEDLLNALLEPR